MGQLKDLTGQRFGKVRVISRTRIGEKSAWICKCDCGVEKAIRQGHLNRTKDPVRSCGCLKSLANLRHGLAATPEYRSWHSMIHRCFDPNYKSYPAYGGAGITVCERWKDVRNFVSDMGPRPAGTSLDRIDGTKGYFPGNCRWATSKEQGRNQKSNRMIKFRGGVFCLSEICEITGFSRDLLKYRLARGISADDAVAMPVRKSRLFKIDGRSLTMRQIAKRYSINYCLLKSRLLIPGITLEQALSKERLKRRTSKEVRRARSRIT